MKRPNANLVAGVAIALGLVIWPYLGHSQQYQLTRLEYIFTGLMVAIGLNVVTGFAGQLSLGPGAVYAIGGYTAAVFADHFPTHFGLVAMCVVAVAGAAIVGLLIGVPSLRVGGFYLGMTTLFVALLIPTVVSNLKITGKEQGISLLSNIDWEQRWTGIGLYQITLAAVLLLVVGSWWLLASRVGHRFVTLATSEELSISLGIAPFRTKLLAFLLSALPAGLGGAFYVYTQQFIAPGSVSAQFSIYLLAACVVGGFGTVLGPFVGGLLVIGLSQYLGGFEQWEGLIFGVLLIGFAVGLPEGITGFRRGRVGGLLAAPLARTLRLPGSRASIAAAAVEPVAPGTIAASPERVSALLANTEPKQLAIVGATRSFGGVVALDDVDLTVQPGTIHGLIGSNGSGKTTLLNAVSGFYRVEHGMITLGDLRIDRAAPHRVARGGCGANVPDAEAHRARHADREHHGRGRAERCARPAARARRGRRVPARGWIGGPCRAGGGRAAARHPSARRSRARPRAAPQRRTARRARRRIVGRGDRRASRGHRRGGQVGARCAADRAQRAARARHRRRSHRLARRAPHRGRPARGRCRASRSHPGVPRHHAGDDTVNDGAAVHREAALAVSGLSTGYGAIPVVRNVSVEVGHGEFVALVGRNGAGKSTAMQTIAGFRFGPTTGTIVVEGRDVSRARPADMCAAGLALVPEGHRVFPSLTVRENLRLGGFPWRRTRRAEIDAALDRVTTLFPVLGRFASRAAGALSGGQQQMVAIGQALVADPRVLMIDEPSSGLAPAVVDDIYRALTILRDEGRAILLVEQNIERALAAAARAYVLERGQIVLSGNCAQLARDGRVADIVRGSAVVEG